MIAACLWPAGMAVGPGLLKMSAAAGGERKKKGEEKKCYFNKVTINMLHVSSGKGDCKYSVCNEPVWTLRPKRALPKCTGI